MRRLNFGCGPHWHDKPDWVHLDVCEFGQRYVCDITEGTPFADCEFDLIVGHHSLQMIPHHRLHQALVELRRIGRRLRLSVPDVPAAVEAWRRKDDAWFPVLGEPSLDGKFTTYLSWYSSQAMLFTYETLRDWLRKAGWENVQRCDFKQSAFGDWACELDGRPNESLYVEAS